MTRIRAYAAHEAGGRLEPFEYEAGPLGADEVEVEVLWCGICRSDLAMLDDEWGMTRYPFVPGHEVVGRVVAAGTAVRRLRVGTAVGVGWYAGSCMTCPRCTEGDHQLCPEAEQTVVGRHGGFAERVRCREVWAVPLPAGLDPDRAGPLFCGGITVFAPILRAGVVPTERVGVVGIGGLGHLAVRFLSAWGCHVTAFTSTPEKGEAARRLGAHEVVGTGDQEELDRLRGTLDFLLVTVPVALDWPRYLAALAPRGRLHVVGAVPEPIPVPAFSLISGDRSVAGSALGSPAEVARMLDFCTRHRILPEVEVLPMSRADEAMERLRRGEPRFRIVLEADFVR